LFNSFYPADLGRLAWVALVPLIIACNGCDQKGHLLLGLLAGTAALLGIFSWVFELTAFRWYHGLLLASLFGLFPSFWCVGRYWMPNIRLPLILGMPALAPNGQKSNFTAVKKSSPGMMKKSPIESGHPVLPVPAASPSAPVIKLNQTEFKAVPAKVMIKVQTVPGLKMQRSRNFEVSEPGYYRVRASFEDGRREAIERFKVLAPKTPILKIKKTKAKKPFRIESRQKL
jgi:hypothetical protein